jgi:hypothetical protein
LRFAALAIAAENPQFRPRAAKRGFAAESAARRDKRLQADCPQGNAQQSILIVNYQLSIVNYFLFLGHD